MPRQREYTAPSFDEQESIFTALEEQGVLDTNYAVDVLLASAEAERNINEWLDILRDKRSTKKTKEEARKLLTEHSEEYDWLLHRRREIETVLQRV